MYAVTTSCPWDSLEPATIEFCERNLCAWIAQPSNTWSCISFFAFGALILSQIRKDGTFHAHFIGGSAILTGLGSVAFHATGSFVGEAIDESSLFLASLMILTMNIQRAWGWKFARLAVFYATTFAISLTALLTLKAVGIALFSLQLALAFALELKLYLLYRKKGGSGIRYAPILWFAILFCVAYGIWNLDFHRIVCDPDNHWISGHAVWHVINGFNFYLAYRFYRQFKIL